VVLYDGRCRFCTASMRRLLRLVPRAGLEPRSFQDPGVLDDFPGLTHEQCMRAMVLVLPDGRWFAGAEAAARAVALRGPVGKLALAYYVPGLRSLLDLGYRLLAANRYRLQPCEGTCALHREEHP
jgi:predicted DCC family thiol-disulfide oxidoreductase YuxK